MMLAPRAKKTSGSLIAGMGQLSTDIARRKLSRKTPEANQPVYD